MAGEELRAVQGAFNPQNVSMLVNAFTRRAELQQKSEDLTKAKGQLYEEFGNDPAAMKELEQVKKLHPNADQNLEDFAKFNTAARTHLFNKEALDHIEQTKLMPDYIVRDMRKRSITDPDGVQRTVEQFGLMHAATEEKNAAEIQKAKIVSGAREMGILGKESPETAYKYILDNVPPQYQADATAAYEGAAKSQRAYVASQEETAINNFLENTSILRPDAAMSALDSDTTLSPVAKQKIRKALQERQGQNVDTALKQVQAEKLTGEMQNAGGESKEDKQLREDANRMLNLYTGDKEALALIGDGTTLAQLKNITKDISDSLGINLNQKQVLALADAAKRQSAVQGPAKESKDKVNLELSRSPLVTKGPFQVEDSMFKLLPKKDTPTQIFQLLGGMGVDNGTVVNTVVPVQFVPQANGLMAANDPEQAKQSIVRMLDSESFRTEYGDYKIQPQRVLANISEAMTEDVNKYNKLIDSSKLSKEKKKQASDLLGQVKLLRDKYSDRESAGILDFVMPTNTRGIRNGDILAEKLPSDLYDAMRIKATIVDMLANQR